MLHLLTRYRAPLLLLTCAGIATPGSAQVSSSANATTTVVDPAVIAKVSDLDFGRISIEAGKNTLVVSPHESAGTSGANTSGTKRAPGIVIISGASDQSYTLGLPQDARALAKKDGKETVSVHNFTSDLPPGLLVSGSQEVRLGATLSLTDAHVSRSYHAGIPVTVHYN